MVQPTGVTCSIELCSVSSLGGLVVSTVERRSHFRVQKRKDCEPASLLDLLSHLLRWTFFAENILFHVIHVHFQEFFQNVSPFKV